MCEEEEEDFCQREDAARAIESSSRGKSSDCSDTGTIVLRASAMKVTLGNRRQRERLVNERSFSVARNVLFSDFRNRVCSKAVMVSFVFAAERSFRRSVSRNSNRLFVRSFVRSRSVTRFSRRSKSPCFRSQVSIC